MKKLQIFYAKSPEINLATSPAEQAVHGVLFTFNWRTFGYRLLLVPEEGRKKATNQNKKIVFPFTQEVFLTHQIPQGMAHALVCG